MPICNRCEVNRRRITTGGRVQSYCSPCTLEVNRVYKRKKKYGSRAVDALEEGRALIKKSWLDGKLSGGPLWWYLGMTEAQYDRWLGERES